MKQVTNPSKNIFLFLAIIGVMTMFSSCAIFSHGDNNTKPCYAQDHYVGFGKGGWKKGQLKNQ